MARRATDNGRAQGASARWQASFQVSMTGFSRSQPRIESVAGREAEQAAERRLEADPPGGEDAEEVPVREQQDIAIGGLGPGEDPIRPCADLLGGLAVGPRARPDRPIRVRLADGRCQQALEGAVVPFGQVGLDRRASAKPARRAVSLARTRGLVRTRANGGRPSTSWVRSRSPSATAWSRPTSVSGMSVRPVCRPSRAHSVWPWRTSQILRPFRPRRRRSCRRSSTSGRTVSEGWASKNSRGTQPEQPGQDHRGHRPDLRVVPIDLVVVELAPVRDDPLDPLDLVLEVQDVRAGLDVRVALDDGEERA